MVTKLPNKKKLGLTQGIIGVKENMSTPDSLFGNNNCGTTNSHLNIGGISGDLFGNSTLGGTNVIDSTTPK